MSGGPRPTVDIDGFVAFVGSGEVEFPDDLTGLNDALRAYWTALRAATPPGIPPQEDEPGGPHEDAYIAAEKMADELGVKIRSRSRLECIIDAAFKAEALRGASQPGEAPPQEGERLTEEGQ
jgi:hypothetical protein